MTNKQAINILLNEQKCIDRNDSVQCDRKCGSCDLVMDVETIREAYSMAISALEKQIPKDLIAEGDGYADGSMVYDIFYCPFCDHRMEEYEVEDYCPNCGQKICWEDE